MTVNHERGRPSLGVGYNCNIRGSIIDKNARIGDNVTLSPDGKPDGTYAHGVIIRDGVLVVPKGGIVPTGTVI
jgi:glucose-1-phosphate adenylyltransferase